MNNLQKIMSTLGLAQKAGKLASGDTAVQYAVKSGKAVLVLVASDVSDNSRKEITNLTKRYNVVLKDCLTKGQLGSAIGKAERASVAVVDKNFAAMIERQLELMN